jgi:hypothetical protein
MEELCAAKTQRAPGNHSTPLALFASWRSKSGTVLAMYLKSFQFTYQKA